MGTAPKKDWVGKHRPTPRQDARHAIDHALSEDPDLAALKAAASFKALSYLMERFRSSQDLGYLRINTDECWEVFNVKWKFTAGKWSGHYVFDRCTDGNLAASLGRLAAKVDAVRADALRPTRDTFRG